MENGAFPLLSQRIMHDALKEAINTVDELLVGKDPRAGAIVPLLGPTRVGKSEVAKRLVAHAGAINTLLPSEVRDVVRASLPAQTNGADIYGSILKAMQLRVREAEKTKALRDRVYRGIREWGIKAIVFDETNHFAERGSNLTPRAAADHLKSLVDETGVSLILSGLPRFQKIIDQNEQLRDRASGTVLFQPYDWQLDNDRDAFAGAVDTALSSLETSGFSVELDFENCVRRLYGASGGRVPMMLRILKILALSSKSPAPISLEDFAAAAAKMQQSSIPISSFFKTEEPDETDLFASFASVMSEAGLDYDVETVFGLEANLQAQGAI